MENIIKVLQNIETNIGLRVNYEKTSILRIGNVEHCLNDKPIIWDPGGMTVLGIDILADPNAQYLQILEKGCATLGRPRNERNS